MLMTLPLLAALSMTPAQADGLALSDARVTYGILGPTRANTKFLPGDSLYLTFTINGIAADAEGKVLYSIGTEVTDAGGKSVFKSPVQNRDVINALGGNEMPAFAQVAVGQQQPAGDYVLKVTVTDLAAKKSQVLEQKFEVLKPDFGLVRLSASADPDGQVPSGLLTAGHSLWLSGAVVGFQRGAGAMQPNVTLELKVLDADGKPTVAKPFGGTISKDVPAKDLALPIQFHVALNRPGKFTLELKATDQLAGKTATQSFPITVHPLK
ncbi:MAG TPA: hypothetical protein VKA46_37505 [Gemmataceae bacterium]|nr:hypothetical protein [Gemmataceae bacterium]